jgi:hypothetical protein
MQRYSNVIQALVYVGAAFLVVIVGLRGLGDLSQLEFMPKLLLEESTGRISVNIVIFGLVAEFTMLMALALVFFKAPLSSSESISETKANGSAVVSSAADVAKLVDAERHIIETLGRKTENLIDSERRIIEQIGSKYNDIAEAQRQILELLSRRLEEHHSNDENILRRIETNVDFLKSAHLVRRRPFPENTPTLS